MARRHYRRPRWIHKIVLLALPLLIVGAVYAAMSQSLLIGATARPKWNIYESGVYVTSVNGTFNSSFNKYDYTVEYKNFNPFPVSSIRTVIGGAVSDITCNANCEYYPGSDMATFTTAIILGPGETGTLRFQKSTFGGISINVDADPFVGMILITGLNTTHSQGSRSKSGSTWWWPITFTVINGTDKTLTAWEIDMSWSATESVMLMPTGVSYVIEGSRLKISRVASMPVGSTYQFTADLGSTSNKWTPPAITTRGQYW